MIRKGHFCASCLTLLIHSQTNPGFETDSKWVEHMAEFHIVISKERPNLMRIIGSEIGDHAQQSPYDIHGSKHLLLTNMP